MPSQLMLGRRRNTIAPSVNTLRRPRTVTNSPATREILVAVLIVILRRHDVADSVLPETIFFKDNEGFFKYQCEFGQTEIKPNDKAIVAIVHYIEEGKEKAKNCTDKKQIIMLRVASPDGGFIAMSQTASEGTEILKPKDLVLWLPLGYADGFEKGEGVDPRTGNTGVIIAKISCEIDVASSNFNIIHSYLGDDSTKDTHAKSSFINSLWNGEKSLGVVFWFVFMIPNVIATIVFNGDKKGSIPSILVMLFLAYFIFSSLCAWNTAKKSHSVYAGMTQIFLVIAWFVNSFYLLIALTTIIKAL